MIVVDIVAVLVLAGLGTLLARKSMHTEAERRRGGYTGRHRDGVGSPPTR